MKNNYKNEIFDVKITNLEYGFSFEVPSNFLEVGEDSFKKLELKDNTLYSFSIDDYTNFHVMLMSLKEDNVENYINFTKRKLEENKFEVLNINKNKLTLRKNKITFINNLVEINGLIINFAISSSQNIQDKAKILDKITDSIKVLPKENIPLLKEALIKKEVKSKTKDFAKLKEEIVKKEIKYRNIKQPKFFLKYSNFLDNKLITLTVIDDEIAYNNNKVLFKKDKIVGEKFQKLVDENKDLLSTFEYTKLNNSYISIKYQDKYYLVDKTDYDKIIEFLTKLEEILNETFNLYVLKEKEEISLEPKEIVIEEYSFTKADDPIVMENDLTNDLFVDLDLPKVDDLEKITEDENQVILDIDLKTLDLPRNDFNLYEETYNNMLDTTLFNSRLEEKVNNFLEQNEKEDILLNQEELEQVTYTDGEYKDVFHKLEDTLLLKASVPKDFIEKVDRSRNIFDIFNNNIYLRFFTFKCDTLEAYETKLKDWMEKNYESIGGSYKSEQIEVNNYRIDVNEFDNRIYYTTYINNYLVSVSCNDYSYKETLFDILDSVEILEGSEREVENIARENKNNRKLLANNLPELDIRSLVNSFDATIIRKSDILKRAIAIILLANEIITDNNESSFLNIFNKNKNIKSELKKYDVYNYLTAKEKEYLKTRNEDLSIELSWRIEGAYVLLYVLGLIDKELDNVTKTNIAELKEFISSRTYGDLIIDAKLKDEDEILDLADYSNRLLIITENYTDYNNLDKEIVIERDKAYKYILSGMSWDVL